MTGLIDPRLRADHWRVRWETKRVNMVLETLGLTRARTDLYQHARAATGESRMTFDGFRTLFPTFPVCLAAAPIGGLGTLVWKDLSKALRCGSLRDAYSNTFLRLEAEAGDRPVGLVVPIDIRGGLLLHNAAGPLNGTVQHVVTPIGDRPPGRMIGERLLGVLDAVARSGWTPASRRPVRWLRAAGPTGPRVPPADLVRDLRSESAVLVLHWLVAELASGPAVGRVDEETFGVTATDKEIAESVGVSIHQARRGLGELEARGLLARESGAGRRVIVLTDEARTAYEDA